MKNKGVIVKCIVCCLITIALIVGGGAYLGYRLDPPESEYSLDAIEAFHELPENSQDVIIYGSSHAWKDVDTRVLRNRWGLAAYNYGCNWQAINTTQLFLEDSFAPQSPKVVCIETYMVHNVLKDVDMDGQIYYTRKLPNSSAKMRYLRECFGSDPERYASYYFPLIMFHDNWSTLDEDSFEDSDPRYFVENAGYNESDTVAAWEAPDIWSFP